MLTWCVQKKQPIAIWKNLFYLCNDPLVLGLFAIICLSVVSMSYFLQQFEIIQPKWDSYRLTLCSLCCCFGFVCEYKPKIISNRIFFIFCVFGCMISTISMMSIIFKFVTTPLYENQIQSVQEIIARSFHVIGDEFALQHLTNRNEVYLFVFHTTYINHLNCYSYNS